MAFMAPEYLTCQAWHVDGPDGVGFFFASTPFDNRVNDVGDLSDDDDTEAAAELWFAELIGTDPERVWSVSRDTSPMIYARLSAPGYMDATEWSGPFATEVEARAYITDTFDVDADTGETLEEGSN